MMRLRHFLTVVALLFGASAWADETARAVPEYTMKAAYLYNFAQLTDWPEQSAPSAASFNLCIYGQDDFGSALEALRGKSINNQPIRLIHINDTSEARQCHMLFIGETEGNRGSRLLEGLRGDSVLTVSDDKQNSRGATMLLINVEERRLSFEVNLDLAKRSRLKFSSKLLRLAKRVTGE